MEKPGRKSSKRAEPKSKAGPKSSKLKQKSESDEENVGEFEFGEPVPSTFKAKSGPKSFKKENPGQTAAPKAKPKPPSSRIRKRLSWSAGIGDFSYRGRIQNSVVLKNPSLELMFFRRPTKGA